MRPSGLLKPRRPFCMFGRSIAAGSSSPVGYSRPPSRPERSLRKANRKRARPSSQKPGEKQTVLCGGGRKRGKPVVPRAEAVFSPVRRNTASPLTPSFCCFALSWTIASCLRFMAAPRAPRGRCAKQTRSARACLTGKPDEKAACSFAEAGAGGKTLFPAPDRFPFIAETRFLRQTIFRCLALSRPIAARYSCPLPLCPRRCCTKQTVNARGRLPESRTAKNKLSVVAAATGRKDSVVFLCLLEMPLFVRRNAAPLAAPTFVVLLCRGQSPPDCS